MMNLDTALRELSLVEYKDVFDKEWCDSEELTNTMEFLTEKYLVKSAKLAGINVEFIPHIIAVAEKINHSAPLKRLFAHAHYLLFCCKDSPVSIGRDFPDTGNIPGNDGFTYNLVLALSGVKSAVAYFKNLNVPEDVIDGALKDISIWVTNLHDDLGVIGITPRTLNWERGLMKGHLFRLGRLQFGVRPFGGRILVFRHKDTNQVQALLKDGIKINSLGQFDGVDGHFDSNSWTSSFTRDEEKISGNPVTPGGKVLHETLCLKLDKWNEVLVYEDPILDIHIPAGERLDIQSCADSINYALEFFPKYFPEKKFKGFACNCWFLDNQFEKILPENSNIIKFQREFYLYPLSSGGGESYSRIFGKNRVNGKIENISRKTSMQKAVTEFTENGGRLRAGGGFFLKEDIPWGRRIYRQSASVVEK